MLSLIAIIVLGLIAAGMIFAGRSAIKAASAIPILILLGVFFFSSYYTLDTGEAAVVTKQTGGIEKDPVVSPGMHFKSIFDGVVVYDIRNQPAAFIGDGSDKDLNGDGEKDRVDAPTVSGSTSDGSQISVDIRVNYSIDPASITNIYTLYRTQEALKVRVFNPNIGSAVRQATGKRTALEIVTNPSVIQDPIREALQNQKDVKAAGIIVDSVIVEQPVLPAAVRDALNTIQLKRAAAEAARADLEKAKITAEQTKTEAQAQSDADQIIRCGAKSVSVEEIVNGVKTNAVKVIPVAQADCQNRLNDQVIMAKYIDMLKEATAKTGTQTYVLPTNPNQLLQLGK